VPALLPVTLARFDEDRPHTPGSPRRPRPAAHAARSLPAPLARTVGAVRSARPLGAARSNLVLLVQGARGRFVVKVASDPYRAWQLRYEHDIMRGLAAARGDLPLAQPLGLAEEDGYTFLLQSCADGRPGRDGTLSEPARVAAAARLRRAIHAQPLPPLDYQDVLDRQLRLARRHMCAGLLDPGEFTGCGSPAGTLRRLERDRPPGGQAVLLHGDYRPKNILWRGTRATSIVDWGLALPGDAHYDLAVMRWHVGAASLWQRFTAAYGLPHDPALVRYFDLLSKFLNI
jgi:aminoglycoside 3'-phosphotransferase-2